MSDRQCRVCGIDHIAPGMEIDGEPLCWAEDDLCSHCQDQQREGLERDAARYRFLRNRQMRIVDIAAGGVFAGRPEGGMVLGGEHLDRAIDAEMGADIPHDAPLEDRLAGALGIGAPSSPSFEAALRAAPQDEDEEAALRAAPQDEDEGLAPDDESSAKDAHQAPHREVRAERASKGEGRPPSPARLQFMMSSGALTAAEQFRGSSADRG